jgi:hypothetical protein
MTSRRDFLVGAAALLASAALPGGTGEASPPPPLGLPVGRIGADDPDGAFVVLMGPEGPIGRVCHLIVFEDRLELHHAVAMKYDDGAWRTLRGDTEYAPPPDYHTLSWHTEAGEEWRAPRGSDLEECPVGTLMLRCRTLRRREGWAVLREGHAPGGRAARLLGSWTRTPPPLV